MKNQIIFITHSPEFVELKEIDKVTIIRQNEGESRIYRSKSNIQENNFLNRTLTRLLKTEQKEFFFAKKVLLVEGETEFGAFPIFGNNLEYNFDLHSISIIPVGGNYFVGFVKILQEFEIPSLIACDRDVLMNVNSVIKIDNFEIKTSSIFNQLNELDLLTDDDKQKLSTFKDSIIKIVPEKWKSSQEYRMYEEIKNDLQKKPRQDDNKKTRDNDGSGNRNGNTLTIEECKNKGSASGFDTALDQECQNLTCTHPGENTTCVQEGVTSTVTPTPTIQVSGQGKGQNFCPNAEQSFPAIITFSAQQSGSAAVQGQFTVTVDLGFGQAPIIKTGTLNDLQISGNTFTLTGTELSQGHNPPVSATITGQCGTGVTIQFTTADGEHATFTGNVACT